MRKVIFLCLGAMMLMAAPAGHVAAQDSNQIQMGIVTGGPSGTYYQFGLNLEKLVARNGINLRVDNSKGSVENI